MAQVKTDELIRILAADSSHGDVGRRYRVHSLVALLAGVCITGAIFSVAFGFRADIGTYAAKIAIANKLAFAAALAILGVGVAGKLSYPVQSISRPFMLLIIPVLIVASLVAIELYQVGTTEWQARMTGKNLVFCLIMISLFAIPPLAAMLFALRAGAVTRPVTAGLFAGIGSAGFGSIAYALFCTDDSMLFVGVWYTAATIIVAVLGAILGKLILKW